MTKQVLQSACPLDCPDACSLDVTVEHGRVISLDGNQTNPVTGGYICGKVRQFPQHLYGPDRVLEPQLRVGPKGSGQFRAITWDEALQRLTTELQQAQQQFGGESILPCNYGGSNGYLTHQSADARLFYRLGASRLARTICAAPSSTAVTGVYGKMPGASYEDYPEAKLIIAWGVNSSATGIHLIPYLREAQQRGAKLVVIDPRRTPLARQADRHLAIRPGTDLPVALAIHRYLFESGRADTTFIAQHCAEVEEFQRRAGPWTLERAAEVAGISLQELRELAEEYADASPALIRCGWGVERNYYGGSAVAAIVALPAIAGKFGPRGGGFTLSNSAAWSIDPTVIAGGPAPATRTINMNQVGDALLELHDPKIAVLFVFNSNPLSTFPRQDKVRRGLEREDLFTVVHEQVMTDTAKYADLLLPATTFLEHHELHKGYGALILQASQPVVEPVGQAWPNYRLFSELSRRLGLARPDDPETPDEIMAAVVASSSGGARIAADLSRSSVASPVCGSRPRPFVDVFPATADGKVHLVPEELDRQTGGHLYCFEQGADGREYPLQMISPASSKSITSTLAQLIHQPAAVEISHHDAHPRGVSDGDAVRVFNQWGEVHCRAKVSKNIRPGVVSLAKGLWARHTQNGCTSNQLVPDTLTDLGGGACFNDARVEVQRLA